MKAKEIIKKPDFIGTLRQIGVGEAQKFKMTGTAYSSMHVAVFRLNNRKEGKWKIEYDKLTGEMTVTRLS